MEMILLLTLLFLILVPIFFILNKYSFLLFIVSLFIVVVFVLFYHFNLTLLNLLFAFFFILVLTLLFMGGFSIAPWFPTKKEDLERIFEMANLKKGEKIYELGCGDGRFLFEAVKRYDVKGVGIEISPYLYLCCEIKKIFFNKKENISFKLGNFLNINLAEADVVYFFGSERTMKKVKEKIEKELKEGSRVISYAFEIEGWIPEKVSKKENELPIFLYVKK